MEIFFDTVIPTYYELKQNLVDMKKKLYKDPLKSAGSISLIMLPDYLIDVAVTRISADETDAVTNSEINHLLNRYSEYIDCLKLASKMILSKNTYLEKLFIQNIEKHLNTDLKVSKNIDNICEGEIKTESIEDTALAFISINRKVKKEGINIIDNLNFNDTNNVVYKILQLAKQGFEASYYLDIYERLTKSYIKKQCEIIKGFLIIISENTNKIGDAYDKNNEDRRKTFLNEMELYLDLSFRNLLETYDHGNKKTPAGEELGTLIDFMSKVYKDYYNNNFDRKIFENYLKESNKYSGYLNAVIYLLNNNYKDIRKYISILENNYLYLYEVLTFLISDVMLSIKKKDSMLIIKEIINSYLEIFDDDNYIDWEKQVSGDFWDQLGSLYPDNLSKDFLTVLKDLSQLLFNIADNSYSIEPLSGKDIKDIESFISYCFDKMEEIDDPRALEVLLGIKRNDLLSAYKKRLLIITDIIDIDNTKPSPSGYKKYLNKYL